MATLTAAKRKKLPKSSFALGGGRYPIHDAAHARNALARVAQHGSPREQAIVRAAVKRRYPAIGQAGKKAQIRKAFGAKAKARGTSLSAAQLAVIDLAVDAGYLDLAGKWRHGWIPLDGAALMSKRHGRKGGSLSHYHGGGKTAPPVRKGGLGAHGLGGGSGKASGEGVTPKFERVHALGKGRAGSSVTSAIQVGKGGRGKSGLSAPKPPPKPAEKFGVGARVHVHHVPTESLSGPGVVEERRVRASGTVAHTVRLDKGGTVMVGEGQLRTPEEHSRVLAARVEEARLQRAADSRARRARSSPPKVEPKATRITDEQIKAGAAQLRSHKGKARDKGLRAVQEHDQALEGMARALEARHPEGLKAHAARLDGAAAHYGEASGTGHRKVATRGIEIARQLEREQSVSPPKVDKAAEKRQALNRRAGAHTVPVTRRSKPAAPSQAQRDANLGALEVRKAGSHFAVYHKPSGLRVGAANVHTKTEAEALRQAAANTHHDLTVSGERLKANREAIKHVSGVTQEALRASKERASNAAAAARARKTLPTGGGKLTNPSRPGDLAVFSKTQHDYQIGKPGSSHEEHTPVRLTHVSKEGHALGGYDAAGHYRTIDNRTTTRVLPQDKVDVHAFMEHIKQTNRWHAGSDSVKPHYGSLEETQRAAKQFARPSASSPPKVDKMSTRGENRGMTSTEKVTVTRTRTAISTRLKEAGAAQGRKVEIHSVDDNTGGHLGYFLDGKEMSPNDMAKELGVPGVQPSAFGNYSEMRKIAEARYGKPSAPSAPAKPSAPASHITAQEAFRMSKADLQVKADKGDPVASAELRRRAAKKGSTSVTPGTHVRVTSGYHAGKEGHVAEVSGGSVAIDTQAGRVLTGKGSVEPTGKAGVTPKATSALSKTYAKGDTVTVGFRQGKIERFQRMHGQDGAMVSFHVSEVENRQGGVGYAPHWVPLSSLKPPKH